MGKVVEVGEIRRLRGAKESRILVFGMHIAASNDTLVEPCQTTTSGQFSVTFFLH